MFKFRLTIILILWTTFLWCQQPESGMSPPRSGSFPLKTTREILSGLETANLEEIAKGSNVVHQVREEIPLQAVIVRSDVEIKGGYRAKEALPLWSVYYVYKYAKTNQGEFYYLGFPSEEHGDLQLDPQNKIGWIDRKYLIDYTDALRTDKKIYRRVIVFENRQDNRVSLRSAPSATAEELYKTPYFSFFYLYKESDTHFLIGITPTIILEDAGHDILGWIDKQSCREWNTRLAANYFTATREQREKEEFEAVEKNSKGQAGFVRIYRTIEDAQQLNINGIVSQETEETRWDYNMLRFPLLTDKKINQSRLFQIAFLSGGNSDEAQQILSIIREQKENIKQLDIVLLLDASLTKEARDKIIFALNRMSQRIKATSDHQPIKLDIAWCVAFYHDFSAGRKYPYKRGQLFRPQVIDIHDFNKDLNRVAQKIYNQPYRMTGRYDPKALYYGIDMAVNSIKNWREGSTRCIITVGITGNHDVNSPRHVANDLNPAVIQESLKKNSTRLYGVQFEESLTKSSTPSVQSYAKQITEITQNMGEGGYILISPIVDTSSRRSFTFDIFLDMLVEQYRREIGITNELIGDLSRGFPPEELTKRYQKNWANFVEEIKKGFDRRIIRPLVYENSPSVIYPPSINLTLQQFVDRNNINFDDLKGKGIFYTHGWTWEFHPTTNTQQIQISLLVDKLELVRLMVFLASLSRELKTADKPNQYIQIWQTLLRSMFGMDTIPANEPLDNLISQHSGLPFMNGLLTYTLDDFALQAQNPQFRRNIIEKLDATCNKLQLCIDEQETELKTTTTGVTITQNKKRWWKELGSDMMYAWLEMELFP